MSLNPPSFSDHFRLSYHRAFSPSIRTRHNCALVDLAARRSSTVKTRDRSDLNYVADELAACTRGPRLSLRNRTEIDARSSAPSRLEDAASMQAELSPQLNQKRDFCRDCVYTPTGADGSAISRDEIWNFAPPSGITVGSSRARVATYEKVNFVPWNTIFLFIVRNWHKR